MNKSEKFRNPLYEFDSRYLSTGFTVIGIDEAGRGPLAGPVVVAGCILNPDQIIDGLDDSKKLSASKRAKLFDLIKDNAVDYAIEIVPASTIDEMNILQATLCGMRNVGKKLNRDKIIYLIDGNQRVSGLVNQEQIVKGDSKSASIAAASILAKVTRDNYMLELAKEYPEFGFDAHFGYPTKRHFEALDKFGATEHHRRSFSPVKKTLERGKIYVRQQSGSDQLPLF